MLVRTKDAVSTRYVQKRFGPAGEDEVSESSAATEIVPTAPVEPVGAVRVPYVALLIVGLGGLFAGVTGPLLSAFVPPLVRDALGDQRTAIGAVMAIDNFLLLLLVPLAGATTSAMSA